MSIDYVKLATEVYSKAVRDVIKSEPDPLLARKELNSRRMSTPLLIELGFTEFVLDSYVEEILQEFNKNGIDFTAEETINYAKAAAQYIIDLDDPDYTVKKWYRDTDNNYPDDLKNLPRRK